MAWVARYASHPFSNVQRRNCILKFVIFRESILVENQILVGQLAVL